MKKLHFPCCIQIRVQPYSTRPRRQAAAQQASGCSSGVEHNLAKVGVEGSNPFARSSLPQTKSRAKARLSSFQLPEIFTRRIDSGYRGYARVTAWENLQSVKSQKRWCGALSAMGRCGAYKRAMLTKTNTELMIKPRQRGG